MEEKLILNPNHLKSKVLSTLTICGGALFLFNNHAAADANTNNNQPKQIRPQDQDTQQTQANVTPQMANTHNGVSVDDNASEVQEQTNYNVVPATQDQSTQQTQQATAEPKNNYGYLDSVSLSDDQLNVSGWQATNQASDKPYHFVIAYDNTAKQEVGRQLVQGIDRPDVAKAHPDATNAENSGFNTTLKLNVANDTDFTSHSFSIVSRYSDATSGEGNNVDFWYPAFTFDQGNYAYLDSMHTNKDGQLTVTGWNATNQVAGKNYHYVILYDQTTGRELSRQLVNTANSKRPDVASAYQKINNAVNSGFNVTFNLKALSFDANDKLQIISRYSNAANGEGQHVDYWFAPANRDNQGHLDSVNFSNGQLTVTGWHADDASAIAPNHFLILYDQTTKRQAGVVKATEVNRSDVAKAFSAIQTAGQSGFTGSFNASSIIPGHVYSLVSRYSTSADGNGGNGHYVDYWFNNLKFNDAHYSIDSFTANGNQGFHITGWMASDQAISRPNAYLILLDNGKEVARTKVNLTDRPDVAAVYPALYNSRKSGFSANLNVNPDILTGNLSVIMRFTDDANGNGNFSDQRTGNYAANAGYFDTTAVSGNTIQVAGWHASTQEAGKPYQFIIVVDQQGHELARQKVDGNATRNDVNKAYPWLVNSAQSGFSTSINITPAMQHKAVRLVHRYSNLAICEGNYVDYWSDLVSVNSGMQNENGVTVYYDPVSGVKQTGWVKINNNNYYFDSSNNGAMLTGKHAVAGKTYDFGSNGIAVEEDNWGWPFPADGEGHFSGAQLFGVNPGGQFRRNGFHDGLDFGSVDHPGSQVHAIHGGKVVQVGYTAGLDWYVLVDTGEYLTVYQEAFASRNDINVHVGQQISTGDVIGRRDTSHVHIGITRQHNFNIALANSFNNNGTWLNPLTIIRNGLK